VDHIYLKTGYEQVRVNFDDIFYLEASGNYVTFVLKDKKILSRSTFIEAISLLPADKFVRVHRSFLVATGKIEKVERHQVTVGGRTVPVSEGYADEIFRAIKNK
jgi:two-component system LytT family response regulator